MDPKCWSCGRTLIATYVTADFGATCRECLEILLTDIKRITVPIAIKNWIRPITLKNIGYRELMFDMMCCSFGGLSVYREVRMFRFDGRRLFLLFSFVSRKVVRCIYLWLFTPDSPIGVKAGSKFSTFPLLLQSSIPLLHRPTQNTPNKRFFFPPFQTVLPQPSP